MSARRQSKSTSRNILFRCSQPLVILTFIYTNKMKCDLCDDNFNVGVQCRSCKKQLDFRCASKFETDWRNLSGDRTAAWECPSCRISSESPSSAATEQNSLLNEIEDLKRHLFLSPSFTENMYRINEEIEELKDCCEYIARRLESSHKVKDRRQSCLRLSNHCSFFKAVWRGLRQN